MGSGRRGSPVFAWLASAALALVPGSALAAFHLMEIEQVIGGVDGDTSAQAVQLKMRAAGQQFVAGSAQLVVRDAAGANPVVLSTFPAPNPAGGLCREILLATPAMAAKTTPPLDADFVMSPIPASYLAAGTLTFEAVGGTVYWRTSWGGAAYTGSGSVIASPAGNDDNGNANPAFAGPLPSTGGYALRFTPACPTLSSTSALQYAVTPGPATFVNNDLTSFAVAGYGLPQIPALPGGVRLLLVAALGGLALSYALTRRRKAT
jgi:hypothetical protein